MPRGRVAREREHARRAQAAPNEERADEPTWEIIPPCTCPICGCGMVVNPQYGDHHSCHSCGLVAPSRTISVIQHAFDHLRSVIVEVQTLRARAWVRSLLKPWQPPPGCSCDPTLPNGERCRRSDGWIRCKSRIERLQRARAAGMTLFEYDKAGMQ